MELTPFLFGLYKLLKYAVYPLSWLVIAAGLLTVLTLGPLSARRLRWVRALAAWTFLVAYLMSTPLVAKVLIGLIEQQAPSFDGSTLTRFDAIVVLGGGVVGKGTLRPSNELAAPSLERTLCGAELFARGIAPRLVFSGGDAAIFGHSPVEAAEMKRLAMRLGVPEDAIRLEERSRTTYESAVHTTRLLGEASVILVTSASHMPRALALFQKQGVKVTPYPCGYLAKNRPEEAWAGNPFDLIPQVEALRISTLAITEMIGRLVYRAGRAL